MEKNDWRAPNRLLVVQTGDSPSQAKVFKAHAVPQGLCENVINALKLLANQQKDGDSPIQSIVTGFFVKKQKRYEVVGYLKEGTRSFRVRRPKVEEVGLRGVNQGRSSRN